MIRLLFSILLFANTSLCIAQEIDEVNINPEHKIFELLEGNTSIELTASDQKIIVESNLPNSKLPLVIEGKKLHYSKVDGMPILKPYVETSTIPKFYVNPNIDYKLLKKE